MAKKYRLVIFDFDGTLADTSECIVKTAQRTMERLGLPMRSEWEIKQTIGLPLEECFRRLVGENRTDNLIERCTDYYREEFFTLQEQTIRLFPGVKGWLQRLKDEGVKIAIATSRGGKSLGMLCDQLGIGDFITMRMSSDLVTEKKPAPEMVERILTELKFSPDETLVVGDTVYDIEMGQRAGCDTCGVTWGNQSEDELKTLNPTMIISEIQNQE